MHVVIFTGGIVIKSILVTEALTNADMIIAADSGATTALVFGVVPEIVLGDMDSIEEKTKKALAKKKIPCISSPAEKDETDTELAIDYAIKNGATEIVLLGGISGDRTDHILANILYAGISSVPITFINGMQKSFVAKGPTTISLTGQTNDLLSLVPLSSDAGGISTTGLKWELKNGTLIFGKPRGVSNVFLQNTVHLQLSKGILFITHTYVSL